MYIRAVVFILALIWILAVWTVALSMALASLVDLEPRYGYVSVQTGEYNGKDASMAA